MCQTKSLIWVLVVILLLVSCCSGEECDLGGEHDNAEAPTDAPNAAEPTATTTLQPTAPRAPAATETAAPTVAPTSVPTSTPEPADKSAPIAICCGSGHRSTMAMTILWSYGYEDVRSLKGGFGGWVESGYPIVEYEAMSS